MSFRVIGEGPARRVENRIPGADVNPYVAIAAAVAAGVNGIENKEPFPELADGDGYTRHDLPQLPTSLPEALELFGNSEPAKHAFGQDVHDHLLTVGRGELAAFLTQSVTDWEQRRYFERT
jgi:glutamine synthetase